MIRSPFAIPVTSIAGVSLSVRGSVDGREEGCMFSENSRSGGVAATKCDLAGGEWRLNRFLIPMAATLLLAGTACGSDDGIITASEAADGMCDATPGLCPDLTPEQKFDRIVTGNLEICEMVRTDGAEAAGDYHLKTTVDGEVGWLYQDQEGEYRTFPIERVYERLTELCS